MTYRTLKWITIILPTSVIGGFEFFRHSVHFPYLTMEQGNFVITLLALLLAYLFATWMFNRINEMNRRITEEQSRRAVYEERERLARELHEHIAQTLFYLNVKLNQGDLAESKHAVAEIDHHMRQAIFNLRSTPEETGSLTLRLEKWLYEWSVLTGISVEKKWEGLDGLFSSQQEVQLFSLVQEAFHNIRKHADATQVWICWEQAKDGNRLSIRDNGNGLDDMPADVTHYGIRMMQEMADKLGAAFGIVTHEQGGTEVSLTFAKMGPMTESKPRSKVKEGIQS
ncbi:sensor histidine kinase [Brevibacillus dissolubilis]|uniref:sensor histidine kinase n=1 Tax=Brevibacillus dissolubilis TaxID=1844116 RepID=UPI001115CD6E|nr:ATP-binding protein [Brevibacillus dissolubilis]